ncbi:hypothetical protein LZ32DRAFT_604826 [Colletotrichum eremochloae]|nr:hypothetical protein LZ32DRAFT_604826 [Colletotrichum eremochloae]
MIQTDSEIACARCHEASGTKLTDGEAVGGKGARPIQALAAGSYCSAVDCEWRMARGVRRLLAD